MSEALTIQQRLAAVAAGTIRHIYNGDCPDDVEGPDARDPDCPACQVLAEVAGKIELI